MQYFRNYEIARLHRVSPAVVVKWVAAARAGKLDIQLYEQDGKHYIANTPDNLATIRTLVKQGKKYVNTRGLKNVTPTPDFYKVYSAVNIADIISNLEAHREIPLQYTYFDGGADRWDKFTRGWLEEKTPNMLTRGIELLESNLDTLEELFDGRRVNVIDIGVGNCLPVKGLISFLLERQLLHRYIGIDDSLEMLNIAQRNIKEWFGNKVRFESHVRDISRRGFDDLLIEDYFGNDEKPPINVVLLFGGTLSNLRMPDDALRVINNSMSTSDLFIYYMKLDTSNSRRYFVPFDTHRMPVDLLNIDPSWYEVETFFDEQQKARFMRIRLTVALSIKFEVNQGQRQLDFAKDETILVWRYWHQNALDVITQLDRNRFDLLRATKTADDEYLLAILRTKRYRHQ
jgi:uncharacterized SAM-dependent methyltransferase